MFLNFDKAAHAACLAFPRANVGAVYIDVFNKTLLRLLQQFTPTNRESAKYRSLLSQQTLLTDI